MTHSTTPRPPTPSASSADERPPRYADWPPVRIPGRPPAAEPSTAPDPPVPDEADGPRPPASLPDAPATEGDALLNELRAAIARYVILPDGVALDAVTLWTAATHLQPAFQHAPRLAVVAPVKRCGKSRLLDVLHETVHDPCITVNATPAAIFRSITDEPPTLLVDEADTLFGSAKVAEKNEEMRGLLNAGHQRNRYTLRVVGNDHKPHRFNTFAMAAIAGIGDLPDTIMDRAVVIRMRRKVQGERAAPFRTRRDQPGLNDLRDRLAAWLRSVADAAAEAEPDMPVEDRAADTWEPLVVVADLAGGSWPRTARVACAEMTAAEAADDDQGGVSVRLLADCRRVFAGLNDIAALSTGQLLNALRDEVEAPWADHGTGGLTPRALGILLKGYGISSSNIRFPDGNQRKGFTRSQFVDAWHRYCPEPDPEPPRQP